MKKLLSILAILTLVSCAQTTETNTRELEKKYGKCIDTYFGFEWIKESSYRAVFKDSLGVIHEVPISEGVNKYYEKQLRNNP